MLAQQPLRLQVGLGADPVAAAACGARQRREGREVDGIPRALPPQQVHSGRYRKAVGDGEGQGRKDRDHVHELGELRLCEVGVLGEQRIEGAERPAAPVAAGGIQLEAQARLEEAPQFDPWLAGCLGYWSQPLRAYAGSAVWDSDPKLNVFRTAMDTPFHDGYAGPIDAAAGSVLGDWVLVDMFARVVMGESSAEDSIRQAVRGARRYYK